MGYIELEKQLAKKHKKRRIILALCAALSFILFIFAMTMRDVSREVTVLDYGFYQSEIVRYNENWIFLILPSVLATIYLTVFFIADIAFCHFNTFEKDSQYVTIYRGMITSLVFVDGKEVGRIEPLSYEFVIETILMSGVKVIISFPRRRAALFEMVHVAFSDNTPSIEI